MNLGYNDLPSSGSLHGTKGKQGFAYAHKNEIALDDLFLWTSESESKKAPSNSGLLRNYPFYFAGTHKVLRVTAIEEGRNFDGDFVDFVLEDEDGAEYRINGYDAMCMERKERLLTKAEIRKLLEDGLRADSIFAFRPGQDCDIFKAHGFKPGNHVIYIADIYLNDVLTSPSIEEVMEAMYTGDDFIAICGGDIEIAKNVFYACDWQHPSTEYEQYLMEEKEDDDEEIIPEMPIEMQREITEKMEARIPMCFECMSDVCIYNPEGFCAYPLIFGNKPIINDNGCQNCVVREE